MPAAVVGILAVGDFAFVEYLALRTARRSAWSALLATVGLLIRCWARGGWGPGLLGAATTIAAVVLVSTKPQYGPLALVLGAALLVRPLVVDRAAPWRGSRLLHVVAAVVVVSVGAVTIHATPPQFSSVNRYDAFFYELLGHSPNPSDDLRSFDLPTTLAPYAGTSWYSVHNASKTAAWPVGRSRTSPTPDSRRSTPRTPTAWPASPAAGSAPRPTPHLDYLGNYPAGHRGSTHRLSPVPRVHVHPHVPLVRGPSGMPLLWLLALGFGLVSLRSGLRRTPRSVAACCSPPPSP